MMEEWIHEIASAISPRNDNRWRNGIMGFTPAAVQDAHVLAQIGMTGITKDGLVGYWPLNKASLQGSNTFLDLSGKGNHGTSANAPNFTTGPKGNSNNAMVFNAIDDQIDMGDVLDIGLGDYSVSLWFRTSSSGAHIALISKYHPGYFLSVYTDNKLRTYVYNDGVKVEQYSDNVVNDGEWHNAIVTFDRDGYCTTYIDNVEQSDKTDISSFSAEDWTATLGHAANRVFLIGRGHSGRAFMNGDICNIRIYNRALPVDEIEWTYYEEKTGAGKTFYYADKSMSMSDGNYYDGRLSVSTLQRAFSSFTAPKQRHSTLTITLKDADLTVRELLDLYTWGNREVKVYVGKGRNLDDYSIDFHGIIKIPGGISFDRKEVFIKLRDVRNSDELMLPINKYWTTDYPNLEEKAEGKPIPIAYGDYSSMWIDVYCIDTTAKKFKIADHAIKSIENVTKNGEVGTSWSSPNLTDATFILDEEYDPDNDTVGVKFKGKVDGESNLIEKPIDILEDLLKNYVAVSDENIDQDSFDELNIETGDVRCRRYIADEISSNTLMEELAIENMFDLFIENDKYTARSRMPKIQVDATYDNISIMPDSMRVDSDPEGLYANQIKCNYRYDQLQDKYMRHSQEDNVIEQDRIGQVIPRTINFNWLWVDSDVHALAMHLIMLYSREINVIKFTALGDGILTKLADRVGLTFANYVGRPLVVREISKHFNTMSCTIFGYDEVKHVLPGYITANDAPDYDDATLEERATMGFLTDDDGEAKPGDEDSKVSHIW